MQQDRLADAVALYAVMAENAELPQQLRDAGRDPDGDGAVSTIWNRKR